MVLIRSPLLRCTVLAAAWVVPFSTYAGSHKEIDLKTSSDADGGERQVSICARPSPGAGVPGHMFVALSEKLPNKERSYLAIGHTTAATPVAAVLSYNGILGTVNGYLGEEKYTASQEQCLVLNVNRDAYAQTMAMLQPDLSKLIPGVFPPTPKHPILLAYSLGASDCMALAIGVATNFQQKGVAVPKRESTELPMTYVRRMIDAN